MNLFICYTGCSTCKKTERYLDNHGISYEKRDIKKDNPSVQELKYFIKLSGKPIKSFFNTSGLVYKELNLKEKLPNMSEEQQLSLLESNGMLVKRPILVLDDKVLVGFKEQQWDDLIK